MKRVRTLPAVAAVAATALLATAAGAGTLATSRAFAASFAGRAVVQAGSSTATITATGTGTATVAKVSVGKVTLAGRGIGANSTPCPTFIGTGVISSLDKKSTITFAIANKATACVQGGADSKVSTVLGASTVKAGTGKYAKAKGTLKFAGVYDRGKGTYTVKFTGTLTY